jgi:hypothetical protein
MLTLRPFPIIFAVFVGAVGGAAAVTAQALPEPPKALSAPIEFYLARGEADACGRGCNEWIAAEGKIDASAAQRLRQLLAKLGRSRPPIYFHSPGGQISGSLELGRLIREQKMMVSVGHTIPLGCDRGTPLEKSCEAQKRAGQALQADFDPNITICNSGCSWAVAGGAVRLIPPWVKLGIHDLGFDPEKKAPRGALADEVKRLLHGRIQEYLREMGMDKALHTAAAAVPFESNRFLERGELARFGIDRREFGEAVWLFVDKPKPLMLKMFFVRTGGDQPRYFNGVVGLDCGIGSANRVVVLGREHVASEPPGAWPHSVSIGVSGQRIDLPHPFASREFDGRAASLPATTLDAIGDNATIEVSGFDPGRDDGAAGGLTLNTDGFSRAYAKLRKSCDETERLIAVAPSTKPPAIVYPLGGPPVPSTMPPAIVSPLGGPPFGQVLPAAPGPGTLRSGQNGSTTPAEPTGQSCTLQIADTPEHRKGRVTGFLSDEEALAGTKAIEDQLGAKISPAYLSLRRASVEAYPRGDSWNTGVGIPERMAVEVGDLVELNSRHRDPSLPCHFIPWTINRIVDHAQ